VFFLQVRLIGICSESYWYLSLRWKQIIIWILLTLTCITPRASVRYFSWSTNKSLAICDICIFIAVNMKILCFNMRILCFNMRILCFSLIILCYNMIILCFNMIILCFSMIILCYNMIILCFNMRILCFSLIILCYNMIILCFNDNPVF
jgi:hypothetical protein